MKNLSISLVIISAFCLAGCTSVITTEKDRNGDGKIDYIFYEYELTEDADYGFLDNDYDGLFEIREYHWYQYSKESLSPQLSLSEIKKRNPNK